MDKKIMIYTGPQVILEKFNGLSLVTLNNGAEVGVDGENRITLLRYDHSVKVKPYYVSEKYLAKKRPEPFKLNEANKPWMHMWDMSWKEPSFNDILDKIIKEDKETIRKDSQKIKDFFGSTNIEVGGQHYQKPIQPWDYIAANGLGFDEGNVVKYITRHKGKNGAEDVKKAISYCQHILKTQYKDNGGSD